MAHLHNIYDSDSHFSIDPITRAIKNESSKKTTIIQHDHNSERFTFEMPRYIEGHDMTLCNKAEVHYINVASDKSGQSSNVYVIDDMQVSPEDESIVICSWLISQNATMYSGSLNFLLRFVCTDDNSIITYAWNTGIFTSISVSNGILNNAEEIITPYVDVLAKWENELFGIGDTEEQRLLNVSAEQQAAIEEKGQIVLESIPEDYTTLGSKVDENTAKIKTINQNSEVLESRISKNDKRITNLEKGLVPEPFETNNAIAYEKVVPLNALPYAQINKVGGMSYKCYNLIPFPYRKSTGYTETTNGVTFTILADGGISVVGTPTKDTTFPLHEFADDTPFIRSFREGETYTVSGGKGYVVINIRTATEDAPSNTASWIESNVNKLSAATGVFPEGRIIARLGVFVSKGKAVNEVIYPMLNEGSTALPYETYFEGLRDTKVTALESKCVDSSNIDTFPISAELRAFLEQYGYGRGVNANWHSYIDFERKVYVHKPTHRKVLDGTENWYTKETVEDGSYAIYLTLDVASNSYNSSDVGDMICNKYDTIPYGDIDEYEVGIGIKGDSLAIYDLAYNGDDVAAWKAHLAQNPLVIEYATGEPNEIDLSAYLTDDNFIVVEGGGSIVAVNDNKFAVPSEILYQLKGVTA